MPKVGETFISPDIDHRTVTWGEAGFLVNWRLVEQDLDLVLPEVQEDILVLAGQGSQTSLCTCHCHWWESSLGAGDLQPGLGSLGWEGSLGLH